MFHTVIITATEFENFFALRCPQYSLFHENVPLSFRSKKDFLNHVHKVEAPEFKTQYDNLSEIEWLQCNKGQAEIHMMTLAEAMWDAYNESVPKELKANAGFFDRWHIPFIKDSDIKALQMIPEITSDQVREQAIKIATARCARVSYTVVGEESKEADYKKDIELHDRLLANGHMSPFEHCAKAMSEKECWTKYDPQTQNSSFDGWSGNFRGFQQYRKMIPNENRI